MRLGTDLTPSAHVAEFKEGSILTSFVPIDFCANFLISLTATGARCLKPSPRVSCEWQGFGVSFFACVVPEVSLVAGGGGSLALAAGLRIWA